MDSLQIQDTFEPYYVGRKPFVIAKSMKKDFARGDPDAPAVASSGAWTTPNDSDSGH